MAIYEVWTIGANGGERYVGLVDGATRGEAETEADERFGHGNPGGLELRARGPHRCPRCPGVGTVDGPPEEPLCLWCGSPMIPLGELGMVPA
jgi:hypothetical protein